MPDIVEVIAKINVEAGSNAPLEAQINSVKKQAEAIDDLTRKRDLLNRVADRDKNTQRAQQARTEADKLTKSINAQTAALTKQIQTQNLVARAAQNELGIIQKLNDRLNDLTQARERQKTVEGIKQINSEIAKLNDELRQLTATQQGGAGGTGGGGLLSQLLGISSGVGAGRQVLQGVLAGAGIGVGFSIIPAITTSLIEYTARLLDTRRATAEVNEASKALGNTLQEALGDFVNLNKSLNDLFGSGSSAYSAAIEKTNALGVIEGEVYQDRVRRFNAEQEARRQELQELDEVNGKYRELRNALVQYDNVRNLEGLRDRLKEIGLSQAELSKVNKTIDDIFSGLTQGQRARVRLSENDALQSFGAESITRANRIQESITNAQLEFDKRQERERFELQRSLSRQNEDNAIAIQQAQLSREEATTDNINKQYDLRGRLLTEQLNREVEETRKAGNLTADIQREYDERFKQIKQQNEAERLEALRLFGLKQLQQQEAINALLLQNDVQTLNQQVQLLTGTNLQQRLDARNSATDAELAAQQAASSKQFTEQTQALEKQLGELRAAGKTEEGIYKQTQQNILDLGAAFEQQQLNQQQAAQRKRIDNIRQAYADVIAEVNKGAQQLQAQVNLDASERNLDISAPGGGGLFGRGFRSRISGLQTRRDTAGVNLSTATAEIGKAQQALAALRAQNAPAQVIDEAEAEVKRLQTVINNANAEIANSTRQTTSEFVNAYADAFKSILETAQQGYNTLQEYRIADLDREIDVREQRVSAAVELAKMGNTELLDAETKRLRAAQAERRKEALQQQAINSGLQLSYALLAVAKATAEGGGVLSAATVAAALAALFSGYALVRSSQRASETTGFAEGGYTGDGGKYERAGTVHKGEFVMNAKHTARLRPVFEHIHRTGEIPVNYAPQSAPTRYEFERMEGALYEVRDAVQNIRIKAENRLDGRGVTQLIEHQTRREHLRWK